MIIQYLAVLLLGLGFAVLHTTALSALSARGGLDLFLALVVVLGLFKDPVHGSLWTAALGYIQDVVTGNLRGMFMTSRMSVFILAQALRGRLNPETRAAQLLSALLLCGFDRFVFHLLKGVFVEPIFLAPPQIFREGLGILINAALVPVLYAALKKIPGFVQAPEGPAVRE